MSQQASIDVATSPELRRIVEEIRSSRESIVLRLEDEDVAVLLPLPTPTRSPRRVLTQAEIDAVMSAAGSWKGLVDIDRLKAEWKAARGSNRPPIEL